jgi:UDP-galactopyranose mutase
LKPKIVVVGSGLFGLTIAERIANILNLEVLVIEKREHIGGNAWSEFDDSTGIEIHKYGSHLFHTSHEGVWEYVNQFSEFNNYTHRVWTNHSGNVYPLPINLSTISQFYGRSLSPVEARELIGKEVSRSSRPNNDSFEDLAINAIGEPLYEAFIKGYTQKQWQTDPKFLPPEVFSRLPIRFNFDNRYFNDRHEGLPLNGYMKFLLNMADQDKIRIETCTDFFTNKDLYRAADLIVYTGPLDRFFDFKHGLLGWRTLDFEIETIPIDDFQGTSVMNYADENVPFTRIHEFQHLHPERSKKTASTVVMKEFSRTSAMDDEPYYPIKTESDRQSLEKYRGLMASTPQVIFGGRLGTYNYLDMHMAIASALQVFETQIKPRFKAHE